jgi:hypothetical protein
MSDVKFLTDENGVKTDIILNIDEYYSLLEEIEDLRAITKRLDEEIVPHNIVKEMMFKNE